jgi:hypothetical protein
MFVFKVCHWIYIFNAILARGKRGQNACTYVFDHTNMNVYINIDENGKV